jgi:hypothetical protein
MNANEPRDDEILGRALSRAIETADIHETPYERSRVANIPAPRRLVSMWQLGVVTAALVFAVAVSSWSMRPPEGQPGAAASPTASATATATPAVTPSPGVASPNRDRVWVYFARDGLPPAGGLAPGGLLNASVESRIASRITALGSAAAANERPAGTTNAHASRGISVRVQGDVATVEFDTSAGWGVRGDAQSQALLQQLVYTITEEPGIRRALITEKGKPNALIDQLLVDHPLSREDVFGYANAAKPDKVEDAGTGGLADVVDWRASVDEVAPGLGRFVVELKPRAATGMPAMPRFTAQLVRPDQEKRTEDGKWWIQVALPDAVWNQASGEAFHCCPLKPIGKTPIRQLSAYPLTADAPGPNGEYRGVGFTVTLDDARPWRAAILQNPLRLVIDIGGVPSSINQSIAVYSPKPGDDGRQFTLSGMSRTFEATTAWRILDAKRGLLSGGTMTASRGTSALWGTYEIRVQLPAALTSMVVLEVYWVSPRDGSDMDVVRVPLTAR